MKKKIDVKNTMQIHSLAKVDFYAKYLNRYLRILYLSEYIKHINIYDIFCGMGIYEDGHKGSPIVAYEAIKKVFDEYGCIKKVSLFVNEDITSRVNIVKEYINKLNKDSNCCVFLYYNEKAEMVLDKLCSIISKTESDTRNLIFIDPYGYKEIKREIIYNLMNNKRTEIILFLPISHMYRFTQYAIINEDRTQYKPLSDFITSFFNGNHPIIRSDDISILQYINYIKEALSYNHDFYTTSYHIERNKNSYFALFFISSNLLGYEKNLEVKWTLDELDGNGFNTPQEKGLFDDEFKLEAENNRFKTLSDILTNYFIEKNISNIELYKYVLSKEFLPKHANQVLSDLQKNNKIDVFDFNTGKLARNNSFYLSYREIKKKIPKVIFKIKNNENDKNRMDR